jgi:hypothetical protein
MQYRVHEKDGTSEVQVLALNAVTMQPMAGTRDIYLLPAAASKRITEASDLLFNKYAH